MPNPIFYIPLTKGLELENSTTKTVESIDGQFKTKHKLRGVASTTSLDRDNEKVSKECLNKMANAIKIKRLPIFGNHEHGWDNMLGYAYDAHVDGESLVMDIATAFEEGHPKVKQLVSGLDSGLPLSLSIGGKIKANHPEKINGKNVNIIDEIEFLETSVVGIGANPDAFVTLNKMANLFKGEDTMEEITKSSGQAGINSYGKLGETTPQAGCPDCKEPSELRGQQENTSVYYCNKCGKQFSVQGEVKPGAEATPTNNVPSPNTPRIDEVPKLAIEGKAVEFKGDKMADVIVQKAAPETEDEDYKKFKSFYAKLMKELEGVDGTPGSANATPKNSINAKSVKEYESMQKAFTDNVGTESLAKEVKVEQGTFDFQDFRKSLLRRN